MTKSLNKENSRIFTKKVTIDNDIVLNFFEDRARQMKQSDPIVALLFQDNNPELAHARDRYEMETYFPLLKINSDDKVLDIGCGAGRWAKPFQNKINYYLGLDPIEQFILSAKETYHEFKNFEFEVCPAIDTQNLILKKQKTFSKIILSGVLQYFNDDDCEQVLKDLLPIISTNNLIFIRTSIGSDQRLTLNSTWSEELNHTYSAIYRTRAEYLNLLDHIFIKAGFKITRDESVYPEALNNRKETNQHIFILER